MDKKIEEYAKKLELLFPKKLAMFIAEGYYEHKKLQLN